MARRPLLKPEQWHELVGIPTKEEDVIRHYSLTQDDLDAIAEKRGDHNRLGYAVQLCLARFPGRFLEAGKPRPSPF